jgi:hypothetical protein
LEQHAGIKQFEKLNAMERSLLVDTLVRLDKMELAKAIADIMQMKAKQESFMSV